MEAITVPSYARGGRRRDVRWNVKTGKATERNGREIRRDSSGAEMKDLFYLCAKIARQTDAHRQRATRNEGEYPHGLIMQCIPRLKCVIFLGTVPSPPPGDLNRTERLQLHFHPSLSFVRAKQSRGIKIISGTITVYVQIVLTLLQILLISFSFLFFFFWELYFP